MRTLGRSWRDVCLLGLAGALLLTPPFVVAQEIKTFKLMNVEGHAALRYLLNETKSQSGGSSGTSSLATGEADIFVMTHSYMYHPNFLQMDLGAGPLWVYNRVKAPGLESEFDDLTYNLSTHFRFLDSRPTPFHLYYDHLNPTVAVSFTESIVVTNEKYGFNLGVRPRHGKVNFTLDGFRSTTDGEGLTQVIDDTLDQATARIYTPLKNSGYTQLQFQTQSRTSAGGTRDVPITPTTVDTNTANLDSRANMGKRQQFRLTTIATWLQQQIDLEREEFRFAPRLRWQHNKDLASFYRYQFFTADEELTAGGSQDTTNHAGSAGANYTLGEYLAIDGDVHFEDNKTRVDNNQAPDFDLQVYGARGSVLYRLPLAFGTLSLNGAIGYDINDQQSSVSTLSVQDERHQLNGTQRVPLNSDFIITSTIVVFNENRNQIYTEGVDYLITIIGATTFIQRIAAGGIPDGSIVSVDYSFETGGTVKYSNLGQNYQANLDFLRYYNAYVRYRDNNVDILAGTPTVPIGEASTVTVGARADVPVWREVMLGGEAQYEEQEGNILSYDQTRYNVYVDFPIRARSTIRFDWRRVLRDNIGSTEDVDLTRYLFRLRSRPYKRLGLTFELTDEEDVGSTVPRETQRALLRLNWPIRKLLVGMQASFRRQSQGQSRTDDTMVRAEVRRVF
ncbi:MAG: hypothetical protein JSW10_08340 [Pseudomonadota bacterium]|nr:MAG: hypothetical protein JSW10_08340 [Pseudomonadota bacterium]